MLVEFTPSPILVNAKTVISYIVNFFSPCNSFSFVVLEVETTLLLCIPLATLYNTR